MALSKKLIEEFQCLYFATYQEEIEYDAAELELQELAVLVRIVNSKDDKDERRFYG
ncbi:MAG: hypothetical protein WAS27_01840 [Candidatus Saccharimonadales bacterium]